MRRQGKPTLGPDPPQDRTPIQATINDLDYLIGVAAGGHEVSTADIETELEREDLVDPSSALPGDQDVRAARDAQGSTRDGNRRPSSRRVAFRVSSRAWALNHDLVESQERSRCPWKQRARHIVGFAGSSAVAN